MNASSRADPIRRSSSESRARWPSSRRARRAAGAARGRARRPAAAWGGRGGRDSIGRSQSTSSRNRTELIPSAIAWWMRATIASRPSASGPTRSKRPERAAVVEALGHQPAATSQQAALVDPPRPRGGARGSRSSKSSSGDPGCASVELDPLAAARSSRAARRRWRAAPRGRAARRRPRVTSFSVWPAIAADSSARMRGVVGAQWSALPSGLPPEPMCASAAGRRRGARAARPGTRTRRRPRRRGARPRQKPPVSTAIVFTSARRAAVSTSTVVSPTITAESTRPPSTTRGAGLVARRRRRWSSVVRSRASSRST